MRLQLVLCFFCHIFIASAIFVVSSVRISLPQQHIPLSSSGRCLHLQQLSHSLPIRVDQWFDLRRRALLLSRVGMGEPDQFVAASSQLFEALCQ